MGGGGHQLIRAFLLFPPLIPSSLILYPTELADIESISLPRARRTHIVTICRKSVTYIFSSYHHPHRRQGLELACERLGWATGTFSYSIHCFHTHSGGLKVFGSTGLGVRIVSLDDSTKRYSLYLWFVCFPFCFVSLFLRFWYYY